MSSCKKAQQDAKSVIEDGMTLVILGEKNHPEVKSINLWANNKGIIIEDEESAKIYKLLKNGRSCSNDLFTIQI